MIPKCIIFEAFILRLLTKRKWATETGPRYILLWNANSFSNGNYNEIKQNKVQRFSCRILSPLEKKDLLYFSLCVLITPIKLLRQIILDQSQLLGVDYWYTSATDNFTIYIISQTALFNREAFCHISKQWLCLHRL